MNISNKLTRFGLTFLVFGTGASLLPGLDTAVLGDGSCTLTTFPITVIGGNGITVTGNGTNTITISQTNSAIPAAVLGQIGSNVVGSTVSDAFSKSFGVSSGALLAHRKKAMLKNANQKKALAKKGSTPSTDVSVQDTSAPVPTHKTPSLHIDTSQIQ